MYRTRVWLCVALLLPALHCAGAAAQNYPSKPIRLILPFPAGAPSDMVGRAVGQKLAEQLGQNIVPDNRAGAGGNVGIAAVAKAPPDGYTILVSSPAIAFSPSLYASLPYDAAKDLAPVARLATIENVLLVHPSVPAKTLKQFVALARARPGKLNFGSGGPGTTNHLANELLKHNEKIDIVHVPYKGATVATLALAGGEVDEVIVAVAPALPLIKAGKVRPLAVLSEKRVPTLPEVPTSKEAGVDELHDVDLVRVVRARSDAARDLSRAHPGGDEGARVARAARADGGCRHRSLAGHGRGDGKSGAQRDRTLRNDSPQRRTETRMSDEWTGDE